MVVEKSIAVFSRLDEYQLNHFYGVPTATVLNNTKQETENLYLVSCFLLTLRPASHVPMVASSLLYISSSLELSATNLTSSLPITYPPPRAYGMYLSQSL